MPDNQLLRVGTIDLQRVFDAFYKTTDYKRRVDDARKEMEMESKNREQAFLIPVARSVSEEYNEWKKLQMTRIHEMTMQLRKEVLDDIKQAVKARAEKTGLDFVMNAGELNVLFVREEFDFTDEIIEVLNRTDSKA